MDDPWAIEEIGKMVDATAKRLISGGFKLSGQWKIDTTSRARFDGEATQEPGVYVFTVNGKVHYVGSAQTGLAKRLRDYDNGAQRKGRYEDPKNREKSKHVVPMARRIIEELKAGSTVTVLTIVPRPMRRKGLPIDPIAGLEQGLIRELDPSWNRRGRGANRRNIAKPSKAKPFKPRKVADSMKGDPRIKAAEAERLRRYEAVAAGMLQSAGGGRLPDIDLDDIIEVRDRKALRKAHGAERAACIRNGETYRHCLERQKAIRINGEPIHGKKRIIREAFYAGWIGFKKPGKLKLKDRAKARSMASKISI